MKTHTKVIIGVIAAGVIWLYLRARAVANVAAGTNAQGQIDAMERVASINAQAERNKALASLVAVDMANKTQLKISQNQADIAKSQADAAIAAARANANGQRDAANNMANSQEDSAIIGAIGAVAAAAIIAFCYERTEPEVAKRINANRNLAAATYEAW